MQLWLWRRKVYAAISRGLKSRTLGILDPESMQIVVPSGSMPSDLADLHASPSPPDEPFLGGETNACLIDSDTVTHVGSYSWMADEGAPTMMVPASPRLLSMSTVPFFLTCDKQTPPGAPVADDRKMLKFPLYPLFKAVDAFHAGGFDWYNRDFVTDRHAMRQLFRCLVTSKTDPFRINLQLVGQHTVLMHTDDQAGQYWSAPPKTFGRNFEQSQTKTATGCEGTLGSHRRIVSYNLAGLRMIVRFEVDACLLNETDTDNKPSLLELRSVSEPGLSIIRSSHQVPQSSLVELKTAVEQVDYGKVFCQLYFSQTPHLFVGKHLPGDGNFHTIDHHQLGMGNLARREEKLQPVLKRFGRLLRNVHALAVKMGPAHPLALVWMDGQLSVRGIQRHTSMLPEELLSKFCSPSQD